MITRLDERRAIAARLDEAKRQAKAVNSVPEVQEARAAADAAREAYNEAQSRFNEVFRRHCRMDDEVQNEIIDEVDGLYVATYDDVVQWIVRCGVTGLPVFLGDAVLETGSVNDGDYVCVLADLVQVVGADVALAPAIAGADDVAEDDEGEGR